LAELTWHFLFAFAPQIQQILTNIVATAIASSDTHHAHLKADLIEDGPTVLIRVLIDSLKHGVPSPLLDGIGLEFTPESLLRSSKDSNVYQGLVISREYLGMLGSKLNIVWGEESGRLRFAFDLRLKSIKRHNGLPQLDNQSNHGKLVKQRETVKILVAEDNVVNMKIAMSMLRRLGFKPASAENGLEVVSQLDHTEYDIILMVRLCLLCTT
jgi:hypothetical protein